MKQTALALSALTFGLPIGLATGLAIGLTGCQQKVSASAEVPASAPKSLAATAPRDLIGSEIQALFADKTVEGHHEVEGYDFQSYYEPDGRFRSYEGPDKTLRAAKWWVHSDEICVRWDDKPQDLCRKMVVDGQGRYRKEKELPGGRRKVVVTFKSFAPGNRYKL